MKVVKILIGVLVIAMFVSCDKQDSPYPYYRFDNADRSKFLTYHENDLLVFENQVGERRSYKVASVVQKKSEYTVGMGFLGTYAAKYYEYDELTITFKNQDGKINQWVVNYSKEPAFDSLGKPNYSTIRLLQGMYMWEWNNNTGGIYPINLAGNYPLIPLKIGNQLIPDVQSITSNSNYVYRSNEPARLDWSINTIYIKGQSGILGFGDVDGKIWLLRK